MHEPTWKTKTRILSWTRKNKKDGVTVTVKFACDKDIIAVAEYSESFSESDHSAYRNISAVTSYFFNHPNEGNINYISTDLPAQMMSTQKDGQNVATPIQFSPVNTPGQVDYIMKWSFSATWVFIAFFWWRILRYIDSRNKLIRGRNSFERSHRKLLGWKPIKSFIKNV